jgi:hypothetical protein
MRILLAAMKLASISGNQPEIWTTLHGYANPDRDGSYVVTKWIVFSIRAARASNHRRIRYGGRRKTMSRSRREGGIARANDLR